MRGIGVPDPQHEEVQQVQWTRSEGGSQTQSDPDRTMANPAHADLLLPSISGLCRRCASVGCDSPQTLTCPGISLQ